MIQVINRSLDILELISSDRSRLYTLNEVSKQLELNKATCANIMKTLVNRGYLEQEGRMTGYRLGAMSYLLTGNYSYKRELMEKAKDLIDELAIQLNEGCILSVLKDNKRLVLYEAKSNHELQVVNIRDKEAYSTSTGRMILAFMDENEQKRFAQKYGLPSEDVWPGIENEEDFILELDKIRKEQLAVQVSKSQVVGVALPIFKGQKVVASLGVYLPEIRYDKAMQERITMELQKTGNFINERLNSKK